MVRLGPKSQIVIPREVRDIFGLSPGDSLLLMADREKGIALVDPAEYTELMDKIIGPRHGTSRTPSGDAK